MNGDHIFLALLSYCRDAKIKGDFYCLITSSPILAIRKSSLPWAPPTPIPPTTVFGSILQPAPSRIPFQYQTPLQELYKYDSIFK